MSRGQSHYGVNYAVQRQQRTSVVHELQEAFNDQIHTPTSIVWQAFEQEDLCTLREVFFQVWSIPSPRRRLSNLKLHKPYSTRHAPDSDTSSSSTSKQKRYFVERPVILPTEEQLGWYQRAFWPLHNVYASWSDSSTFLAVFTCVGQELVDSYHLRETRPPTGHSNKSEHTILDWFKIDLAEISAVLEDRLNGRTNGLKVLSPLRRTLSKLSNKEEKYFTKGVDALELMTQYYPRTDFRIPRRRLMPFQNEMSFKFPIPDKARVHKTLTRMVTVRVTRPLVIYDTNSCDINSNVIMSLRLQLQKLSGQPILYDYKKPVKRNMRFTLQFFDSSRQRVPIVLISPPCGKQGPISDETSGAGSCSTTSNGASVFSKGAKSLKRRLSVVTGYTPARKTRQDEPTTLIQRGLHTNQLMVSVSNLSSSMSGAVQPFSVNLNLALNVPNTKLSGTIDEKMHFFAIVGTEIDWVVQGRRRKAKRTSWMEFDSSIPVLPMPEMENCRITVPNPSAWIGA